MAQVHSTPVRVDSEGYTVTIIVGAGGAGIYYGSSSDPATLASSGTFAAAGSTFLLTGPAWVVSAVAGQSADLQLITASTLPSAGSSGLPANVKLWNALDHGVVGDGVTDDRLNMLNFLGACFAAGGVAYFPAGNYLHDSITGAQYTDGFSHFYLNYAPRIIGAPGATILCKFNGDAWNFGSTVTGATTSFTADTAKGGYVVTVASTAGIAADDVVKIGDSGTIVGINSGTGAYQGAAQNLYRVKSVDSSTQLTLADPLIYAMTVANGAYVTIIPMADRCFIKGLHFKNVGAVTNTASALTLRYLRRLDIDVSGEYFGGPGIQLQGCYEGSVRHDAKHYYDIAVTGNAGQFGYGINVGDMNVNLEVDIMADQTRHAVAVGGIGSDNIRITGVSKGATTTHFDAHGGATNILFDNVICTGGANGCGGIALRGDRYRIRGGQVDGVPGVGVFIFDGAKDVEVKGVSIANTGFAPGSPGSAGIHVSIPHSTSGITIEGVNIDNVGGPGIDFNYSPAAGITYSDVRIVDTQVRNVVGAAVDVRNTLNRARIKGMLVEDNQGSPTTTAGVNITTAATDFTADVECHNSIPVTSGAQSGSVTLTGASTVFTPVVTNYPTAGSFTYNVPAGATQVIVTCIGGGGGGGSGRVIASGSTAAGGGGGGGGGLTQIRLPVSDVTSPVTVTVGAGGNVGAAQATDSTNGSAGSVGGTSSFGNYAQASGGAGGSAGTTATGGNASGGTGYVSGGTGGSTPTGAAGNGANALGAAGGGGGGGGISATPAAFAGGGGAKSGSHNQGTGGTAGALGGGAGGAATAPTTPGEPGAGAGGGGSAITGAGGAGGAGAAPGGGGGGGGAALNGQGGSGAGGVGGAGAVRVLAV